MMNTVFVTIFWLASIYFYGYDCGQTERKLFNILLNTSRADPHNIFVRPVVNEADPVIVRITLSLTQIIKLDQEKSQIHAAMWLAMNWRDPNFVWNPKDYDGIEAVRIPSDKLWLPDIRLFNSVGDNSLAKNVVNTVVDKSGWIIWVPPGQYQASCSMDFALFPYDTQICKFSFGSWAYSLKYLKLEILCGNEKVPSENPTCFIDATMNMIEYKENAKFKIIKTSIKSNHMQYGNDTYPFIDFVLHLQRRPLYYIFSFIVPSVILSIMVVLVFLLPPASHEKMSFGLIVLLSLIVLLVTLVNKVPPMSSSIPLICHYLVCIIVLCCLSVFFSIIVLNLHFGSKSGIAIPNLVKNGINKYLAGILSMKRDVSVVPKADISLGTYDESSTKKGSSDENLSIIAQELMKISKKFTNKDFKSEAKNEWKFAARVVDRLCLILFSIVMIVIVIIMLAKRI